MLHGESASRSSEKTAKEVFSDNSTGSSLPSISINRNLLDNNLSILDLCVISKLQNSKSEVRRLIKGNAVKIDNIIVKDDKLKITQNLFNNNYIKLSIGKKKHLKIKLS